MDDSQPREEWNREDAWRIIDAAVSTALPGGLRELVVSTLVNEHQIHTNETLSNARISVGRWFIRRQDLGTIDTVTSTLSALSAAGVVSHTVQPESLTAAVLAVIRTLRDLSRNAIELTTDQVCVVAYLRFTRGARIEEVHAHLSAQGLSADLAATRTIFSRLERATRRDQVVVPLICVDADDYWHCVP